MSSTASIQVDGQANVTEHTISTSFIHGAGTYRFEGSFSQQIPPAGLAAASIYNANFEEISKATEFSARYTDDTIVLTFKEAGGMKIEIIFRGGSMQPIDFDGSGTWRVQ